jgi:hypothetical protein
VSDNSDAPSFFSRPWVKAAVFGAIVAAGVTAYRHNSAPKVSGENIVALNVGLGLGNPKLDGIPACGADGPACLTAIATYMGSRSGFHADKPDQASCAAVAVTIIRDHRGELSPDSNAWLAMLKTGQGPGVDALRMAVALEMAHAAAEVGQKADDEAVARKIIGAISHSVPGACDTYAAIARGEVLTAMAPELHPDHSACVQKDLSRRDGPGGRYGADVFRAAEGAAALWRESERSLRMGLSVAAPNAKKVITDSLAVIEPATLKISLKKVESAEDLGLTAMLGDVHADAGVMLWKPDAGASDAGAEAGADAGAPEPKRRTP